jgi:hypothetical protein
MESWRKVWREGFAPEMSLEGLQALKTALEKDDQGLIQGNTTKPPPLMAVQDWAVEACCAVSYSGWQGGAGLTTVGEVEQHFAKLCYAADQRLGEPGSCRWFLNAFDAWDRDEMRAELLPEVQLEISRRETMEQTAA